MHHPMHFHYELTLFKIFFFQIKRSGCLSLKIKLNKQLKKNSIATKKTPL